MKRFIITITLLVALVGSAFAWNFKEYGKFKNEKAGEYTVLIDLEATEPFDIEKEDIKFLLYLQNLEVYSFVKVFYYNPTGEGFWCKTISEKHKFYCTLETYEDYDCVYHVCGDGTVIEYIGFKNKEKK